MVQCMGRFFRLERQPSHSSAALNKYTMMASFVCFPFLSKEKPRREKANEAEDKEINKKAITGIGRRADSSQKIFRFDRTEGTEKKKRRKMFFHHLEPFPTFPIPQFSSFETFPFCFQVKFQNGKLGFRLRPSAISTN